MSAQLASLNLPPMGLAQQPVKAKWKGVVMIMRADPTRLPHLIAPMAIVVSPIRVEYNMRRAIHTRVPYSMVKHYFKPEDGDAVEVYAELYGDHLQFYERASKSEFFLVPEQGVLPVQ